MQRQRLQKRRISVTNSIRRIGAQWRSGGGCSNFDAWTWTWDIVVARNMYQQVIRVQPAMKRQINVLRSPVHHHRALSMKTPIHPRTAYLVGTCTGQKICPFLVGTPSARTKIYFHNISFSRNIVFEQHVEAADHLSVEIGAHDAFYWSSNVTSTDYA